MAACLLEKARPASRGSAQGRAGMAVPEHGMGTTENQRAFSPELCSVGRRADSFIHLSRFCPDFVPIMRPALNDPDHIAVDAAAPVCGKLARQLFQQKKSPPEGLLEMCSISRVCLQGAFF